MEIDMDLGLFEIRGEARRFGQRWLLICDLVGGLVGAAIAVAVLVTLVS
jgi:hypothetical protein